MNLITEILNDFKRCCCPFLLNSQQTQLTRPLVDLQLIPSPSRSSHANSQSQTKSHFHNDDQFGNKPPNLQLAKGLSLSMIANSVKNKDSKDGSLSQSVSQQKLEGGKQKALTIRSVSSGKILQLQLQRKSGSQSQSFQTIKSTASRPLSRRNFKILNKSSHLYGKHLSEQDDFQSVNYSQSNSLKNSQAHKITTFKLTDNNQFNKDGANMMNAWMKKQYQPSQIKNYKSAISEITLMKLNTKEIFDSIVHRLEDYYTFNFEDQQFLQSSEHLINSMALTDSFSYNYEESNHQMICSVTKTAFTKSFDHQKTCKFMSLIIIPRCFLPPLAFIQWFNKLEVQSALHCFNKIQYIENSQKVNDNIELQYPLVRVQQFNEKLFDKQNFLLARQIQVVKFESEEDKQTLLEICFEVTDEGKCFERLVRVTAQGNQISRVQIYIQSSQNIVKRKGFELFLINKKQESENNKKTQKQAQKSVEFVYFEQRWKKVEEKLNKDQIINKNAIQIFTK